MSPIGTIEPFNYWTTVISQYANSPALTALIDFFSQAIDQTANMDAFFDNVWNVDTAQGYGLDVLGRIVGAQRTYQTPSATRNLGFEEATTLNADPFNQTPFYTGPSLSGTFSLDDATFRRLILAKAMINVGDGSIPSLNKMLLALFPNRGNCYVVDGLDMTMQYFFTFPLSLQELAVLYSSGVLVKPCGVKITIVQP